MNILDEGVSSILSSNELNSHINSLKKQLVTQILYLPKGYGLKYDGIVFLDRINNISHRDIDRLKLNEKRLFTLSDYGLYLFLLKLSIHFTRIQEKVDRYKGL